MKIAAYVMLMLLTVSPKALAKCSFGNFTEEYFSALKRTTTPVLYAECKQTWGRSLLVIPIRNPDAADGRSGNWGRYYPDLEGRIVLLQLSGSCTENFASVDVGERGVESISVATGGEWLIQRTTKLTRWMLGLPFRMALPGEINGIVKSVPAQKCEEPAN
jgi:hypothetical protein